MGVPAQYGPEVKELILRRLAVGETLRGICRDEGMPDNSTVCGWVLEDDVFAKRYARARQMGLDLMVEEIIEIADDGSNDWIERENENGRLATMPDHEHIQRSRLRVEARKWYAAKMAPKRYGERVEVETNGVTDNRLEIVFVQAPQQLEGDNAIDVTPKVDTRQNGRRKALPPWAAALGIKSA